MSSKRKLLPSVGELHSKFNFDFENGLILNKITGVVCGSKHTSGYTTICFKKSEYYYAHRIIWKAFYNEEPPLIIDHINEIKTDNSINNLKKSDRHENKVKSSKVVNKSGYRGVFSRKDRSSFEVRVTLDTKGRSHFNAKEIHVGYYRCIEEAACAYNIAVKLLNLSSNFLNEVDFDENKVDTNKKFFKTMEVYHYTH